MQTRSELRRRFKDRNYRHTYAESFLNSYIASQVRVLRRQRGLSQRELAKLLKTKQPRVSLLESADHSNWNVRQLKKLARVFDVALAIKFESFGELVEEIAAFSRATLEKPSFDEDDALRTTATAQSSEAIRQEPCWEDYPIAALTTVNTISAVGLEDVWIAVRSATEREKSGFKAGFTLVK